VQVRTLVQADFDTALSSYDVLLSPVAPTPAYKFGEKVDDPVSMYVGDLMTVNLNLASLPAVCVNAGFTNDGDCVLPIGVQMIGQRLSEAQLLNVAHVFEMTCEAARTFPPEPA
jgi:aspartyl-tRNA(Asn)/glutamyl-tRNA(Gln) amidotransferase subunit A